MSRLVPNKWLKTNVLRKHRDVARHIPETQLYNRSVLARMLNQYGRVVMKPCIGTGGHGVVLIYKHGSGYTVHHREKIIRKVSFGTMLAIVERIRHRRVYLVQRGIVLARISGRPVDYRVKLLRRHGKWFTKAIVGKLAKPGLFVTNICRGGTLLRANDALRRSLSVSAIAKKHEMNRLSYQSMEMLVRAFPGIDMLGFDYGIDMQGRIWLLEVNTQPH
ncbi:YheC/YheD family protein [Paenibacillus sp. UNC451MF]|uniref:YheC/YheD family protein n=1 Tax=Paenibacillus sp. UNC451MF TaxID=1449063 RepID=UPI00048D25C6|nr:YheC/YheD family protein [Paenibacillus sp. UNC451MF]